MVRQPSPLLGKCALTPLRCVVGHLGLGTELFVSVGDSSRAACRNDIFNKEKLL
jgi:hypothetical protein